MKYKWLYFAISLLIIIPGIISLLLYGLKPSIDFTGGSLIELRFNQDVAVNEVFIQEVLESQGLEAQTIQPTDNQSVVLRMKPISKDQNEQLKAGLASAAASLVATDSAQTATTAAELDNIVEEIQFATVGPTLGRELMRKTLISVALATGAILLYIAWRFKSLKYGVTAIMAMLHDTLILLGVFSLLGHYQGVEVDTLFVTAVLTTLSFSVHDTIVVYDRVRESLHQYPKANFTDLVNKSIAETLSRSINNSMTIIFMLLALWLLGGETIRWFVFALLIGTIAGTYSSTFTAAPLLDLWNSLEEKRKRKR